MQILGLEVCADTIVGNAMLRGISGGQRKRVTTGKTSLISNFEVYISCLINSSNPLCKNS